MLATLQLYDGLPIVVMQINCVERVIKLLLIDKFDLVAGGFCGVMSTIKPSEAVGIARGGLVVISQPDSTMVDHLGPRVADLEASRWFQEAIGSSTGAGGAESLQVKQGLTLTSIELANGRSERSQDKIGASIRLEDDSRQRVNEGQRPERRMKLEDSLSFIED